MTNTIEIKIQAPPPPEGYVLWDGEGKPPEPCYGLLGSMCWATNPLSDWGCLAYAVPIPKAKPKAQTYWVNVYLPENQPLALQLWSSRKSADDIAFASSRDGCNRITLYPRFDVEGEPTPEERLIEAVGRWSAPDLDYITTLACEDKVRAAYRDLQEMRGAL